MSPAILAGVIFVILSIGAYALVNALDLFKDKVPKRRLQEEEPAAADSGQAQLQTDSAPLVTKLLRRTRLDDALQWELLRAGLLVKPSEMIAISVAAGIGAYMLALAFPPSLITRICLLLIGLGSPWIYVQIRKQHRNKLLITQLPEALQLIASSLRSGFSILRAIEVVANEMPAPISREFRWVLDEVNVGVSTDRAFTHMVRRTASPDVKLMATAIQIQSSVGGDLAEVLDTTSTMIRERFQLTAEVAALTVEGRLSAVILGGLPIGLGLFIHMLNPEYLQPLTTERLGIGMMIGAASLMIFGLLIIKNMLNVDV